MTTPAAPPAPKKKTQPRDYVILEHATADQSWKERGTISATSAAQAIKNHVASKNLDGPDGAKGARTFIAVTARSWQTITVTVETKTTIKLG